MGADGWITLAILAAVVAALAWELAAPDLVVLAGLGALTLPIPGLPGPILSPEEAFAGFANPALAAIGALFIVSAGLRETGLIESAALRLFGSAPGERRALLRMGPPLAAISAFLNNAPTVALMTPVVQGWARRSGRSASRFLLPLSYATVLGSVLTVTGTSVNLMVSGLMQRGGMGEMGFFELLPVGICVAALGLAYLVLIAPRLLPARGDSAEKLGARRREYTAAMRVGADCRLAGQQVEQAGLRQLPGLFLVEIDRGGQTLTPVAPEQRIEAGDRLVFAGVVSTIADLQRIPGLLPDSGDSSEDAARAPGRRLMEAVVSSSSPLVGRSIRDANFRSSHGAAVVAVHRNGVRVSGKIGEIVLRPGDTLLLQTAQSFLRSHRNSPDFYLVSELDGGRPPRSEKGWLALGILAAMVLAAATGVLPLAVAACLAAAALLLVRCLDVADARQAVAWPILLVIGASFGLALAMQKTGAAQFLAGALVAAAGSFGPLALLAAVYAATLLLSELLHHNAAAAIMTPIALAAAQAGGAEPRSFVLCVAVAATCAFANPTTYQAHLIVYGPGGYRFADFLRVGLPLDLLCAATALCAAPLIWGL